MGVMKRQRRRKRWVLVGILIHQAYDKMILKGYM